jgi:hypothetical protein
MRSPRDFRFNASLRAARIARRWPASRRLSSKSDPFSLARAVRVLEAEFALAALVGDYNDTDMAARLQRPNSTSSASGFLMCSLITRAIGRAPISSSSAET